eukprot:gene8896-3779_t
MPPSEQRTRKLLNILAQENSKTGAYQRTPAVFRETQGDTHKTMPAEDWGPSPDLLPPPGGRKRHSASHMSTRRMDYTDNARRSQSASRNVEFRSVFKPRPEQEHVCNLAMARRNNAAGSEWALLDTLEVQMYNDEKQHKHHRTVAQQAATRRNYDAQLRVRDETLRQEEMDKIREGELIQQQVAMAREQERLESESRRQKALGIKNDQMANMAMKREEKARLLKAKKDAETEESQQTKIQLEEEKRLAAEKAEGHRQNMSKVRAENELHLKLKTEAEAAQKRRDAEMMEETLRALELKDREREQALQDFHDKIQARARGAGQKVVADRADRAEREARLAKEYEEERERKANDREHAERLKRERQKSDLLNARKEYLLLKDRRAAAERDEMARVRSEMEEKDAYARDMEEEKERMIRAQAEKNRVFVQMQISDKEAKATLDDVGMSERERYLNLRLLEQAVKIVGPTPKQLTADFS